MRVWRLDVDTLRVDGSGLGGLELAFEVQRTRKAEPNTANIRVWNLTRTQRSTLEALSVKGQRPGKIRTELHAGLADSGSFLLFKGDLRYAKSERDGGDWVTVIEGDDGGRAHVDAQVARAFPPGTRADQVARACADALGVGLGNLPAALASRPLPSFDQGTVLNGRASTELRGVLRGLGLTYSIQHGVLQVLPVDGALQIPVVRLAPGLGMVGSPSRNPEGYLDVTALLIPGLDPGCRVKVESEDVNGTYTVRQVRYQGDASATDWYAHLELQ